MLRAVVAGCVLLAGCVSAQSSAPPAAQQPAAKFDGVRAFDHLKRVVEIGPRPAGSDGLQKTRDYIKQQMTALGLTVTEQRFQAATPIGPVSMVNLSVRIPGGAGQRRLIVAGHYDTKLFKEFAFVGANDAGSSTAFLLELARVLKDRKNELPIELLFLDGESTLR